MNERAVRAQLAEADITVGPVHRNLSAPELIARSLARGEGIFAANGALVAIDSQTLFASPFSPVRVASSLQSSVGFVRHSSGYSTSPSDGYQDIAVHKQLT